MFIECIKLTNFRCFDASGSLIRLQSDLTTFVGDNGAGKTAVMYALMRMFGVTSDQRKVRLQDFHVPEGEEETPPTRELSVEIILAFPELGAPEHAGPAVPAFFNHMAAETGGTLKARIRLEATWQDDGSIEGQVEQTLKAITTFEDEYDDDQVHTINATDRARIQFIYVPAVRNAANQVSLFLKGRLWRAISWSDKLKTTLNDSGSSLNEAFKDEPPISHISKIVNQRWNEVHTAGTDTTPIFRPVDLRIQEFVRKIEVVFHPDENGRDRNLEDLSDGQSSLFHIAMTAATLDLESTILTEDIEGFQPEGITLPALTLIALEEPENNLSPFYLSRIVAQLEDITAKTRAQALVSSHSSSILARVKPEQVRHFRLEPTSRSSIVSEINLPASTEDAGKYLREAVHAYPELYFAKFVILGEGASEEIVIPRIAKTMGLPIDRSFVAIVPLGGRHINHLWKLLNNLSIPHATLLDLDFGRHGGGWGRIKYVCSQLLEVGKTVNEVFGKTQDDTDVSALLESFDSATYATESIEKLHDWRRYLESFGVYFSNPLDLDWAMLTHFPDEYRLLDEGMSGPREIGNSKLATLGDDGLPELYSEGNDDDFKWYRYLFLGRGKPSTHLRVLSTLADEKLRTSSPPELIALINAVKQHVSANTTKA